MCAVCEGAQGGGVGVFLTRQRDPVLWARGPSFTRLGRRAHLPQEVVFMVADGDVLVLGCVGDDLDEPSHLGLGIQGHAEELWEGKGRTCGRKQSRQRRSRVNHWVAWLHPAMHPSDKHTRPWQPRRPSSRWLQAAGPHRWWCS